MQLEELIQTRQDNGRHDAQEPRAKRIHRHVFVGVRDAGLHVGIHLLLAAAAAALLARVDSRFMRVFGWVSELEGLILVLVLGWSLHDCNVRVVVGFGR